MITYKKYYIKRYYKGVFWYMCNKILIYVKAMNKDTHLSKK